MFDQQLTFDRLVPEVADHLERWLAGAHPGGFEDAAKSHLSEERIGEQVAVMCRYVPQVRYSGRILEIGSGFGAFVNLACYKYGWQTFGVEPDAGALSCARQFATVNGLAPRPLVQAIGESLPFADAVFDVVYSTNVLEHVRSPEMVIAEGIRVLKSGGFLQFVAPNYGSWWEGHYGIVWLPNMLRPLARLYVRLYGRDPTYLATLQFINRRQLEQILDKHRDRIEILSWGEDVWEERVRTIAFSEWATLGKLKNIVQWIHRLGLVEVVIWLGKRLHWETPLILTLSKIK